jgi:hypothetical protein
VTTYAGDGGRHEYRGTDTLIFGIVLAVFTFWLFAQSTLNIAPAIRDSLAITESLSNTAISISARFQGSSLWSRVGSRSPDGDRGAACDRGHRASDGPARDCLTDLGPMRRRS